MPRSDPRKRLPKLWHRARCQVGATDHLTVADEALAAFNQAVEPRKLILLPGGHFDAYTTDFSTAAGEAADWFARHLTG